MATKVKREELQKEDIIKKKVKISNEIEKTQDIKEFDELPNTTHGRLLEAVHISGYTFERACEELEWLLENERWKTVGKGYDDINKFIDTIDFSAFHLAIEQRKKLSKKLTDLRATQRTAAKMLGVGQATVRRDLNDEPNGSKPISESALIKDDIDESEPNGSKPISNTITQSGEDAAKLVGETIKKEAENIVKKRNKEEEMDQQKKKIDEENINLPKGKYDVVILDPPWKYDREYDPTASRVASPYPEQTKEEINDTCKNFFKDNCVLWLWTTHKFIWQAKELLDDWGFTYKATLVWNKEKIGMGNWLRMQCEFCLLAIKGKPVFKNTTEIDIIKEKRREHSRKPILFYKLVKKVCYGEIFEYYSREKTTGIITEGIENGKLGK